MTMPFTEITDAEIDALIKRVQDAVAHQLALSIEDLQLLLNALVSLAHLHERLAANDITLHKLRKLAGIVQRSEKLKHLAGDGGEADKPSRRPKRRASTPKPPTEPVIHHRCKHALVGLAAGVRCPECERGTLYKYAPASFLRITGQTPLECTQHLLERLRCNTCGAYFTAPVSPDVEADGASRQQYGYSARALMVVHKYFAGLPFYRQQSLQQVFEAPVSASTVFDQCEHVANAAQPVVRCLIEQAATAAHYHLDDTTNRILNQGPIQKRDRKTGKLKPRSGIYTSGVIATLAGGELCILFQTNIGHAGEWIDEILAPRPADAPLPILMCDALSRNFPSQCDYHKTLCNSHARREFADVIEHFPDKVTWVLEAYGCIWDHEDHCKAHGLSPPKRLAYHRQHSLPVMETLRDWGQQQLDSGEVEANSGLGQAIGYFGRHFEGLTAFCRLEQAELDNNAIERTLKLVIRGRKNALFFKTLAGAAVGDVLMSLIATAAAAEINVFDYLVVLQRHADAVKANPEQWLPWNYHNTLQVFEKAA